MDYSNKNYALRLVTPPADEPVSVEDVKIHTHIDHDVEDQIIETWILSARIMAEDYQRRAYIAQAWEMTFDAFPEMPILLPRAPIIGLISIKYWDYLNAESTLFGGGDDPLTTTEEPTTTAESNDDFIVDIFSEPGRIGLAYGKTWPSVQLRSMASVKIRFAAGYGFHKNAVPANVKDAIMLYCAYRNENRAAEVSSAPAQFFNLLNQNRLYL
jgi:hypothetical protein